MHGKYGLSVRMNKIFSFDDIVTTMSTEKNGDMYIPKNEGWLGQPIIFRIPVITYTDSDDGGQKPTITAIYANMYHIMPSADKHWLAFELDKNSNEFWVVEKVVDRQERPGIKISYATIALNTKNATYIKNQDIMMTLWGTDDVEATLSGFFSGYSMHTLYIGSLKRAKEGEKG